jgi:predicted nucleic acid-binding protein
VKRGFSTRALLDANVLYPAPLRDLLMWLGVVKAFEPFWSDMIFQEWSRNLLKNRPDLPLSQLEYTYARMNAAFPRACVSGFEPRLEAINLPDPDDRHVVAAATHSRSSVIVTFNLRDFPPPALEPYGVEALHPDVFVLGLLEDREAMVLLALTKLRDNLKNPPKTTLEVLEMLEQQGLKESVTRLRTLF